MSCVLYRSIYNRLNLSFSCNKRISAHSGAGNKKARWTEQEEEELRRLFMENQANPETDEGKRYFSFTFLSLLFFCTSNAT